MKITNIQCKVCPISCDLIVSKDKTNPSTYIVEGNKCNRGKEYGIKEMQEPSRVLTSRVLLENGPMSRLPVKTNGVIPSHLTGECMDIIKETKVSAPIIKGDIIIKNILNTGIDVIAARKVNTLK